MLPRRLNENVQENIEGRALKQCWSLRSSQGGAMDYADILNVLREVGRDRNISNNCESAKLNVN